MLFEQPEATAASVTVRIDHAGLWVRDLERMRAFYVGAFGGTSGPRYHNPTTHFTSCFVSFDQGSRIELMHRADIPDGPGREGLGLAHLALAVGSRAAVDACVATLQVQGVTVVSAPRLTGDGYYEAVVLDPEGNRLELVAAGVP